MKHRARQFDLPLPGESFALVGQTTAAPQCALCGRQDTLLIRGQCERCTAEREAEDRHRDFFQD